MVVFGNTKLYATKLGAYSYVQTGSRIFNCEIGRFCSIVALVSIAPSMHVMNKVSIHPSLVQKLTPLSKVCVKDEKVLSFKK